MSVKTEEAPYPTEQNPAKEVDIKVESMGGKKAKKCLSF